MSNYDSTESNVEPLPVKRGRGRPKGSKNKPKYDSDGNLIVKPEKIKKEQASLFPEPEPTDADVPLVQEEKDIYEDITFPADETEPVLGDWHGADKALLDAQEEIPDKIFTPIDMVTKNPSLGDPVLNIQHVDVARTEPWMVPIGSKYKSNLQVGDRCRIQQDGPIYTVIRKSPGALYMRSGEVKQVVIEDKTTGEMKFFAAPSNKLEAFSINSLVYALGDGE